MLNEAIWSKGKWDHIGEWFLEKAKEVAPGAVAKLENPHCTILGNVVYIHEDHDTNDYDVSYSKYIGARLSVRPSFKDWYEEFENNEEFENTVRQDLKALNTADVITSEPGTGGLAYCWSDFKHGNLKEFPIKTKTVDDMKADRVKDLRRARRIALGESHINNSSKGVSNMKMTLDEAVKILEGEGIKLIRKTGIGNYPDPEAAEVNWQAFEAAVMSVKDGGTGKWTVDEVIDEDEVEEVHPRFKNYAHALAALRYTGAATGFEGDCEQYLDSAVKALDVEGLKAFKRCDREFVYSIKDPMGNVLL